MIWDYTFLIVAVGTMALGVLTGITGVFAVLRKQSLLGDSVSHSALAGIVLAFMLTGSNRTEILLLGALFIGLLATLLINLFAKHPKVNFESAMALIMSSFFGLGFILLSQIQKDPNSQAAGLERFIFGQAATISKNDVVLVLVVLLIISVLMLLFWKEMKLYVFDPIYAHTIGLNTHFLNVLISGFIVAGIIMGIQMVGVVLMSALIITPAVAARQWTRNLGSMLFLSGLIGLISGLSGTLMSTYIDQFPPGPAIVVSASVIVFISLFFAPQRGLISRQIRRYHVKENYEADMALINLLDHDLGDFNALFSEQQLQDACIIKGHQSNRSFSKLFNNLLKRKIIHLTENNRYQLTANGYKEYMDKKGEAL